MSKKFNTTLIKLTPIPIRMGVLVSPADLNTVPNIMVAVLARVGRYNMKKYSEARPRMAGSTCIHLGTNPASPSVSAVKKRPTTSTASTLCAEARLARSCSPAPRACEMYAKKPTPNAEIVEPMSQFTVVVEPTAAVAEVPRLLTMAVSMYCTAVCMSCSSMVGHASAATAAKSFLFILPFVAIYRCLSLIFS